MKKIILTMLVAVSVMACKVDSKNKVETSDAEKVVTSKGDVYTVNTEKSTLTWEGFKLTESKEGTISLSEGTLSVSGGKLVGGKFTIDMNSIAVNGGNARLSGHLKNGDFFDVEKFPTATFEITEVKDAGVSGNLTVKGITKNISIPAKFAVANGFVTFKSAAFKIDRTEFGIQFGSTKLADVLKEKAINDLFEMTFDVIAKKQ